MRSSTITPIANIVKWLGINPYFYNGINLGTTNTVNGNCNCMFQYSDGKQWSRQDFIDNLFIAEQIFKEEAGFHPGRTNILDDEYDYYGSLINTIKYPYKSNLYGIKKIEYIGLLTLSKTSGSDMKDYFTGSIPIPEGLSIENINIYFTEVDGNYLSETIYNNLLEYEIRPLTRSYILNNIFYLEEPAYMFLKPSLEESDECLPHEEDTYVDEIAVYYSFIDQCSQGKYLVYENNCSDNCNETEQPFCVEKKFVSNNLIYPRLKMRTCSLVDDEYIFSYYNLIGRISSVKINYITGEHTNKNIIEILGKLFIGVYDESKEWCKCLYVPEKKFSYYRSIIKEKIEDGISTSTGQGNRYQLLLSEKTLSLLDSLPPYYGFVSAMRQIKNISINRVEGASFF